MGLEKKADLGRHWYVVDTDGVVLGRLAECSCGACQSKPERGR